MAWSVLALGGHRDLNLIRRLAKQPTLAKLDAVSSVKTRLGVIPGNQAAELTEHRDKHYFQAGNFPMNVFLEFDVSEIPLWIKPCVAESDSTDFDAFRLPQLLLKASYSTVFARFRAAIVKSDDATWGVICKKTYVTVRDLSSDGGNIRAACLMYNSNLATYFLAMTSSRFPLYNTEVPAGELLNVPLPASIPDLASLNSFAEIDAQARKMIPLTKADCIIIDDFLDSLPNFLRKGPNPNRESTSHRSRRVNTEPELTPYADTFIRVLQTTFGRDKAISATIYQEPDKDLLPIRMITMHLDWHEGDLLKVQRLEPGGLLDTLAEFQRNVMQHKSRSFSERGIGFRRVAFLFHTHRVDQRRVRNLTIIKPDERRYWTRSLAMRDADDLAGAILKAAGWKGTKE
jgi:hypothetical protein